MNVAVLISGRGSNLKAILEAEKKGLLGTARVKIIISNNPSAQGLNYAQEYEKESQIIDDKNYKSKKKFEEDLASIILKNEIDIIVLAGFMKILSRNFVNQFENKIINIHPSLLPSFPGLKAQKQALDYGVKVTGCTVHFVTENVDMGPVILQKAIEVNNIMNEEELANRILEEEHKLLPQVIKLISEGRVVIENRNVMVL
jgi:phosphoribosylglycinamide formyltransferase-1